MSVDTRPMLPTEAVSIPETAEPLSGDQLNVRWVVEKVGAGALLGAISVSGLAAAEAVNHTQVTEKVGGLETTQSLTHDHTEATVYGHTFYIDRDKKLGPFRLGLKIDANKLPSQFGDILSNGSFGTYASFAEDPEKAAESYEARLKHEYLKEFKQDLLLFCSLGALAGGVLYAGGAAARRQYKLVLDENGRLKRAAEAKDEKLDQLEREMAVLREVYNRVDMSGRHRPAAQSASTAEQMADDAADVPPTPDKVRSLEGLLKRFRIGRKLGALAGATALSVSLGAASWEISASHEHHPAEHVPIQALAGTPYEHKVYAGNQDDANFVDDLYTKYQTQRQAQDERREAFVATATIELDPRDPHSQYQNIVGPQEGESAMLVGSDMHSNLAMIQMTGHVVKLINEKFGEGTISTVLLAGDDTYGTTLEKDAVDREAKLGDGAPEATVDGNHDSSITNEQFRDAGIKVLDGKVVSVGGIPVIGMADPQVTPLFAPNYMRDGSDFVDPRGSEYQAGQKMHDAALKSGKMPVGIVHEGYAAGISLDVKEPTQAKLTEWFEQRGSNTVPWEDGVRDLPFSLLAYGHWHRIIEPRTVYNSDGTWTLVMELNTTGGAIANTSITHFNTPLDAPGQTASFPVIFRNNESGLVTGYQMYTFHTDGRVEISPRVDIGNPGGQPYALSSSPVSDNHQNLRAAGQTSRSQQRSGSNPAGKQSRGYHPKKQPFRR